MKLNEIPVRKRWIAGIILAVLLFFSCATAGKTDTASVVKTMIRFDQAFIPALAMTSKGDMKGSEKAMAILVDEWTALKPQISAFFPDDKKVQENIAVVDNTISDASEKLAGSAELTEVHETLEMVKKPFVEIRSENHIEYFPDLLEGYHTIMEEIIDITAGKSVSDISQQDVKKITEFADEGVKQWKKIENAPFDSELFGFNAEKTASLEAGIRKGKNEGVKFVSIAESGSIEAMLKEAALLKPFYTKVYLQFGNFARLK